MPFGGSKCPFTPTTPPPFWDPIWCPCWGAIWAPFGADLGRKDGRREAKKELSIRKVQDAIFKGSVKNRFKTFSADIGWEG